MMLEKFLDQPLNGWMQQKGPENDIVLSSRVRLARNFEKIPFPHVGAAEQLEQVVQKIQDSLSKLNGLQTGHSYLWMEMDKLQPLERNVLVEKHIISPAFAEHPEHRVLAVREDAAVALMVNEEDHLRIQSILPGLQLTAALLEANQVDDCIEQRHTFAFDRQVGYLTACPTNVGTGLRASVMLHLPALSMTKQMNSIVQAVTQIGLAVRGLYGEGSETVGNVFQISNQLTLGQSEEDIVANLQNVVQQVVERERAARAGLLRDSRLAISDRVWRAFGVLRYSCSISGQEALALLSEVRLGIDMGIIDHIPSEMFNELLVITRPNYLLKSLGKEEMSAEERDEARAKIIRDTLAKAKE